MSLAKMSAAHRRYLESTTKALMAAAQSAREEAARTGTPLIVWEDGEVRRLRVDRKGHVLPAKKTQSKKSKK